MTTPGNAPLTHFDAQGQAHMVDVSAKAETHRIARASGVIRMQPATLALIESGGAPTANIITDMNNYFSSVVSWICCVTFYEFYRH